MDGRALYDLLADRPLAVVYEDGALVIEPGPPDVYKFIDGGWKASLITGEREGERALALADGVVAAVRFPGDGFFPNQRPGTLAPPREVPALAQPGAVARKPVHGSGAKRRKALPAVRRSREETGATAGQISHELWLWLNPAHDVPAQAVTVLLNERVVSNLTLSPGLHRYRVPLAQGRVLPGENLLRLHFRAAGTIAGHRSAAAIERITVGPVPARAQQAEVPPVSLSGRARTFGIGGDARPALSATTATRWSYYLLAPEDLPARGKIHLFLSYGLQAGARPAEFAVHVQRDGEAEQQLWTGRGEPGQWLDAEVDLSRVLSAGRALRLDLSVSAPGAIAWPRLVDMDRPAGPAALPPVPGSAAPVRAEHVILFVVDALRGDLIGRMGGALPAFARLLKRGVFQEATTQGNYPLPAHASLLSGAYPAVHHLVRDNTVMSGTLPLLPEALQRAGFATGLFSGTGYVSERWGLRRGFDAYRNLVREGVGNSSSEVWKVARPWLEQQVHAGHRSFLYLATADPHAPYTPPADLLARIAPMYGRPAAYTGPVRPSLTTEQLLQVKRGQLKLSHDDRAYLEALYQAEVLETDATLGLVLDDLLRLGIADKTVIVLCASHGEEFFDHGSVGHGHSVYQELVGVPLIWSFPSRLAKGSAVPLQAELIDVAPTLLDLAGAAVPETMQGRSLLPFLAPAGGRQQAGAHMPRAGLSQHDQQLRGFRLGRYKIISAGGDRLQLYDLVSDPHEQTDVSAGRPVALRALRNAFSLLYAYQRRWNKQRHGGPADLLPGFAEDLAP